MAAAMRVTEYAKYNWKEKIAIESYVIWEAMVRKQVDSLAGSVSVAVVHNVISCTTYVYGDATGGGATGRHPDDLPVWLDDKTFHSHGRLCSWWNKVGRSGCLAGKIYPEFPER